MNSVELSKISLEQLNDDAVFRRVESLIKKAKSAYEKAQAAEWALFQALADMCIEPSEVPTAAENAENLEEAIACYLSYGEYSVKGLMCEIKAAYAREDDEE